MYYAFKSSLFSGIFLLFLLLLPLDLNLLNAVTSTTVNQELIASRTRRSHDSFNWRATRDLPYNYSHNGHRYYPARSYGYGNYGTPYYYSYGQPYNYNYYSAAPYDGYGNYYYTPQRSGVSVYLGT